MAVVNYIPEKGVSTSMYITWILRQGDTGQPFECPTFSDKTVHFFGVFGADVGLQGSNDPRVKTDPDNASWFNLIDPHSNVITTNAVKGEVILENPRFIRPIVTGGDGNTLINIILCAKKGR